FAILYFLLHVTVSAQDSTYVNWSATNKKLADGVYEFLLKATLGKGWHIYTKDNQLYGVSEIKISFTDSSIKPQGDIQFIGTVKTINDKIFDNKPADVAEGNIEV